MGLDVHALMQNADNFYVVGFTPPIENDVLSNPMLSAAGADVAAIPSLERMRRPIMETIVQQKSDSGFFVRAPMSLGYNARWLSNRPWLFW